MGVLEIHVKGGEFFNDATQEFVYIKPTTLRLEHSLVSISKWESKWKIPFLKRRQEGLTREQSLDYIKCMTMSQNVDPKVYEAISKSELEKINAYIVDEKTATTFNSMDGSRPNRQVVTSELIYYYMTVYQIPWEAQKWHFSRLLSLIEICNIKQGKQKKMSPRQVLQNNAKLNAARRAKWNSKG